MKKSGKKKHLLTSWKEISEYLDCHKRTCFRYETERGLPVHRHPGKNKSRVYAYTDEIDSWLDNKNFQEINSEHGFRIEKLKRYRILFFIFLIFVAAIIIYISTSTHKNPQEFKIQDSQLIVLDKNKRELWKFDTGLNNLVNDARYHASYQCVRDVVDDKGFLMGRDFPYIIIQDLNGDHENEVLFITQTRDGSNEENLFCFDSTGKLKWKFTAGKKLSYGQSIYTDYCIKGILVHDIDKNDEQEIIVISNHMPDFPTQLAILSQDGHLFGEYWNAGRISDLKILDIDNDKKNEILVAGMNNEYKKGCLFVFDEENIKGQSPQLDPYYISPSLESGTQKYYILLPKPDLKIPGIDYEKILSMDIKNNNRISLFTDISRIYFQLDFSMKPVQVKGTHFFEYIYNQIQKEDKNISELNETYLGELSEKVKYWNGSSWVSFSEFGNQSR